VPCRDGVDLQPPGSGDNGRQRINPFRYAQGAWWAWLSYRQRQEPKPGDSLLPLWEEKCDRRGPFKRPRNAMIAAEQHAILLRRRQGESVSIETGDFRD